MIPLAKSEANLSYEKVTYIVDAFNQLNGLVCKNNKINQSFYKTFDKVSNKP